MGILRDIQKTKLSQEVFYSFSRSSGPGGQNVNKVESRVELRWSLTKTLVFSFLEKHRIQEVLQKSINKEGELVLFSEEQRSREQNRRVCFKKFIYLLEKALYQELERKKTQPSASARTKRLDMKKRHSDKKKSRQKGQFIVPKRGVRGEEF